MATNNTKLRQTHDIVAVSLLALRRVLGVVGLVGLTAGTAWLSAAALDGVQRVPTDLDDAVARTSAVAAALVLAVWSCGAAVTVLAAAARAAGCASSTLDALGAAMTPALLRRVLTAALGVAALGGVAGPAVAAPGAVVAAGSSGAPLTWPAAPGAAAPGPGAAPAPAPAPVPDRRGPEEVVVRSGDTLWSISARSLPDGATPGDVAAAWPRWYRANRAVIGADPDLLHPGQRLVAPGAGA